MAEHIIDAKDQPLGRMAARIARLLQDKHKVSFQRRAEGVDSVIVKNIKELKLSGRKAEQKVYYRHTGYMGHLKEKTYRQAFGKNPSWVLRHAVRGMLPKNFLIDKRMKRLIIED